MKKRFHPTMVLTQRTVKVRSKRILYAFPSHYGSHSTRLVNWSGIAPDSFHPTMVLTQHTTVSSSPSGATCFHPTMVLTQQVSSRSWPFGLKRFHPTMVLTQQHRVLLLGRGHGVSIPLWFSLNVVLCTLL